LRFDVGSRREQSGTSRTHKEFQFANFEAGRSFAADDVWMRDWKSVSALRTSVGANYRAACRSRSRAEFAAKLGIVAEEADETVYWLELLRGANLLSEEKLAESLREANELTAIFTAGRRSSSRTQTSNLKPQTSYIPS
jgi:four helix bundle protein